MCVCVCAYHVHFLHTFACLVSPLTLSVHTYITGDDTLKLWDIRAMKRPINVAAGLESVYAVTSCVFSPDDKLVSTGTSVRKGQVRLTCLLQSPSP